MDWRLDNNVTKEALWTSEYERAQIGNSSTINSRRSFLWYKPHIVAAMDLYLCLVLCSLHSQKGPIKYPLQNLCGIATSVSVAGVASEKFPTTYFVINWDDSFSIPGIGLSQVTCNAENIL